MTGPAAMALGWFESDTVLHRPDPQEALIGRLLMQATGEREIVRCNDNRILDAYAVLHGRTPNGAATPYLHVVYLSQRVCDDISLYGASRQASVADRFEQAYAFMAVVHETGHTTGLTSETAAQCYGIEHVAGLAEAAGASKSQAKDIADTVRQSMNDYYSRQAAEGLPGYKEYVIPDNC